MIKLIKRGKYRLIITKDMERMLYLEDQGYIWSYAKGIGEILSFSKHPHKLQYTLAQGNYVIYKVENEPKYIDLEHLELSIKGNIMQGYLLLTGLPNVKKIRSRIVPTDEIINIKKR